MENFWNPVDVRYGQNDQPNVFVSFLSYLILFKVSGSQKYKTNEETVEKQWPFNCTLPILF
jgi:hypothetical protein